MSVRTPRRLRVIGGSLVALALAIPAGSVSGTAIDSTCRVTNASSAATYGTLAAGVAAATAGDRLVVRGLCVGTTVVDRDLTIRGRRTITSGRPILDGRYRGTVVVVEPGKTVTIERIWIRRGYAAPSRSYPENSGGAIRNEGTLVLTDVDVSQSSAYNGGGISNRGHLTLNGNTAVHDNVAYQQNAGGIDVDGWTRDATLIMNDRSRVYDNVAAQRAGGIDVYTSGGVGRLYMNDESAVFGNHSEGNGGGIFAFGSTYVTLADASRVADNTAAQAGGGIYCSSAVVVSGAAVGTRVTGNSPDDVTSGTC